MILIGRYLAREIALGVVFVLFGFLALFAFFDFINELGDVGRGNYRIQHAIAFVLLNLPSHIYELMPIAALIGAIYALAQFASSSEFTAMRAAGLGRMSALWQIAKVGAVLTVLTAVVGEGLTPLAENWAQSIRMTALGATVAGEFRSGLWMKDSVRDGTGTVAGLRFVNVAEVLPDTSLKGMTVYEFDPTFRLRSILKAPTGRYEATSRPETTGWRLTNVQETRFLPAKGPRGEITQRAELVNDPSRLWHSELTPGIVAVLMIDPDRMSIVKLWPYIQHLQENKQRTDQYEIALWKKMIYPFAVLVMMVLALPFAYLQARAGGIGYKVFAGIMLGVAFHFMNGLFSHLGMLNTWPPWVSVSIPSVVACGVGLTMLWWVERVK